MKKLVSLGCAFLLSGCHHNGTDISTERLTNEFAAAIAGSVGDSKTIKMAYPRANNIHAGDVFINPRIGPATVHFSIGNRKCNLGQELQTDIPMEDPFKMGLGFNKIYQFNAYLRADFTNLFGITIGSETKPTSVVQVKVSNLVGHAVKTNFLSSMYPVDGQCHKAVERALRRGDKVYILKAVYEAQAYFKVGSYISGTVSTTKPIGPVASASTTIVSDRSTEWGNEQATSPVLMAAEFRRITSFADIVNGN